MIPTYLIVLASQIQRTGEPSPPPGAIIHPKRRAREYTRDDAIARRKRINKRRKAKGYK